MTPLRRWLLVVVGVVLVVTVPLAVRAVPAPSSDLSAGDLLDLVRGSGDQPYSGYVESRGTLALPSVDRFTDVGAVLGDESRLRVWWRGEDAWRVNRLKLAGETDLIHDGELTTEYDYEDATANTSVDPDIRLPRSSDLLPPLLARRLLGDVTDSDVARLGTRRIAGRVAPGLRVTSPDDTSRIARVDLWADPDTGVPLRVEVYAVDGVVAAVTTAFAEFSTTTPDLDQVTFEPPPTIETQFDEVLDIADAANQFAPFIPPSAVGGLAQTDATRGAVGVYGSGLTQLITIPLRGREARPLRDQLQKTPGSTLEPEGTLVPFGPLAVLLTGEGDDGGWLIAGTVSGDLLAASARDLFTDTVFVGD